MNSRAHHGTHHQETPKSVPENPAEQVRQRSIQGLSQLVSHYLPSMTLDLQPAACGELATNGPESKQMSQLYQAIQDSEPEAGRFYWSAQCWNMLCWQPVILSVVAASEFQLITDVRQMGQRVQGARVAGLSIPEAAFTLAQNPASLINSCGFHLRKLLDTLLEQTCEQVPINPNLAKRLFADRLLGTLLLLQRLNSNGKYSNTSHQHTEMLASQWLEAIDLQGASDLMRLEHQTDAMSSPEERLALNRKGCCQHFRKRGGKVCASCPKNKMPERIRLIQQSWREASG